MPAHIGPANSGPTELYYGNENSKFENFHNHNSTNQNMCLENENQNTYGVTNFSGFPHQNNFDRLGHNGHTRLMNNINAKEPFNGNINGYYQYPNSYINSCNGENSQTAERMAQFMEDRVISDRFSLKSEDNCIPTPPPTYSPHEHSFNNNSHPGLSPELSHPNLNTSPTLPQHCNSMMSSSMYPWMRQIPGLYTLYFCHLSCFSLRCIFVIYYASLYIVFMHCILLLSLQCQILHSTKSCMFIDLLSCTGSVVVEVKIFSVM